MRCHCQTIAIEERFKRVRTSSQASFGHTQHASTVTSNHFLGELRSLHSAALAKKGLLPASMARSKHRTGAVAKASKLKRKKAEALKVRCVSPYNVLFRELLSDDVPPSDKEPHAEKLRRVHVMAKAEMTKPAVRLKYESKAKEEAKNRRRQALRQRSAGPSHLLPEETAWALGHQQFAVSPEVLSAGMEAARADCKNFVEVIFTNKYNNIIFVFSLQEIERKTRMSRTAARPPPVKGRQQPMG